jgi:PKD repeat protein
MIASSRSLVPPAMTIALTAVAIVAIAIIPFAANVTIINAQQLTNQPSVTQNGTTTLFQSTEDSFRVQVPEGWVIHDVNNTGSTLSEESRQGYGILAQLCPEGEGGEQQAAALSNVSGSGGNTATSCQGSEGDIIHVVRYPDLDTRLQVPNNNITTANNNNSSSSNNNNITIDNILLYHMQKLEEVGYSRIEIVDSTDTTLNVTNTQTNQTITTVPAKNVGMTYNTNFAPNETRTGYFILTATNATAPNLGTTKGYSVFYEGNSAATAETTTPSSSSLVARPLPASVRQVFDSFELVTAVVPTEPLVVEITSSDTEGGGIAPATFEFEADVAGGTEPYTYSWDFDGEGNGESNEQTVSHTFEEAGSYNVGLTVTDSGGQSASDSMEITVEEAPEEEVEEEPPPPAADEVEEEEPAPPAPSPPAADEVEDIQDDIDALEDDVDAFVDDLLDRFGIR